jgi:Ca-activated chloride channel family protein
MHFPEPSRIPSLFSNLPAADSPAFGLLAWLESTRIPLPLRGVEARFAVTGELAEVTVEQLFVQNCRESVDLTYTFPLPARATLFRCEMVLEGRVVAARAMTDSEAQAAYWAAKREGLRALIVEEVRQNLFSLALGNVPPGAVVLLRLVYAQTLERWQRQLALRIPFCPGVRYIPGTPLLRSPTGTGSMEDTDQVPDASRISPPRIDALHPDAAPVFVSGTIAVSDVAPGSLVSPTHPLTWREQAGVIHAGLVPGAHLPDRDLVIRWEMPAVDATTIRFVGHRLRSPEGDYHVLRLSCPPVEVHRTPVDVRVLLDHSSSMVGGKWTKSVEALHAFTRALHPDDRLGLTLFSNTPRDFAEAPLPPAQLLADPRFLGLGNLCPDGGTELLPALQHVAGISHRNPNRSLHLILITDGQVGNEAEIVAAARNFDGTPFHTVGIDMAVNDALLERLAADSGGRCLLLTPADNLVDPIAALAGELGDPACRHLRFSESVLLAGSARSEVRPGQTTTWLLRTASGQSPELLADHPDGRTESLCPTIQDTQSLAPRLLWMQATARAHLARHEAAQAHALAISGNFLVTGISFLAVDQTTRVPIAYQHVEQPAVSISCAELSPRASLSAGLTYSPQV